MGTLRLKRTMKLLLIFAAMVAMVGVVNCGSARIYKRSPQFGLGGLLGGLTSCTGNCNQGKYNVGRALAISGAGLVVLGLATNNRQFQEVGGTALVGGLGLKVLQKFLEENKILYVIFKLWK